MTRSGHLPVDAVALTQEIRDFLNTLPIQMPRCSTDRAWTTAIKHGIGNIGLSAGFLAGASGFPTANDHEWLYDLIWFRNSRENYLEELILALESEWEVDPDEIYYDFEKLLVARAPIKVMIFQDNGGNLDSLWAMLEKSLRTYRKHSGDETYLCAAYRNRHGDFQIKQTTLPSALSGTPILT